MFVPLVPTPSMMTPPMMGGRGVWFSRPLAVGIMGGVDGSATGPAEHWKTDTAIQPSGRSQLG